MSDNLSNINNFFLGRYLDPQTEREDYPDLPLMPAPKTDYFWMAAD